MRPASKILSLALVAMLALVAQSSTRSGMQEPAGANVGNQSQPAVPPDQSPDQKSDDKKAPLPSTEGAAQIGDSGKPVVTGGSAQDQNRKAAGNNGSGKNTNKLRPKGKPQGQQETQKVTTKSAAVEPSEIQNAAVQILTSLDVAIGALQKSGNTDPASTQSKQANDISARRDKLQQRAQTAKGDNAWTDVASGAAAVLSDAVKLLEANHSNFGANAQASGQSGATPAMAVQGDGDGPFLRSPHLPLYAAGLSLTFSVLGLGGGWLLARREINKALIDAGLH